MSNRKYKGRGGTYLRLPPKANLQSTYATTAGKTLCINNQKISNESFPIASSHLDKVCQKIKYVAKEILNRIAVLLSVQ